MYITTCEGKGCLVKKECLRFCDNPELLDMYFDPAPFEIKGNKFTCDMFYNRLVDLETVIFGL